MQQQQNLISKKLLSIAVTPAAKLTYVYLILSITWILLGDWAVYTFASNDHNMLEKLQSMKGLLFVGISATVLYLLSNKFYTDLKLSTQKNEMMEQSFAALNEAARSGIIDLNLITQTATINEKMKFFLPSSTSFVDNFLNRYYDRIHPNDKERVLQEYTDIINSQNDIWKTEYSLLAGDNDYYHVVNSIYIVHDKETGHAIQLIGEIQDISKLKNLQADYYDQQLKHKQRLASSIIKAQENERNRWAEELHDNVSQLLSVSNLYLSSIQLKQEENISLLLKAKEMVTEAQQEIRLLSSSIKPPVFSFTTLNQALDKLIADIIRVKKIGFHLNSTDLDEGELDDQHKLLVYRIVQEQLNNIIKYADAGHIDITISNRNDNVHIRISDDGKGFDTKQIQTGLGLRNIQTRLQLYKGHMKIESSPGEGCKLYVSFSAGLTLAY
ncbi:MAG: PAS domain-containing protein [Chitinophagaceae bacterium]|nr:PAS domain-containing protein [Chitinophagaceae bacterium]